MTAYVFPGQGAQFPGMGKDLYETNEIAKSLFDKANEILGFNLTDIMFNGTEEQLKETKVTQPAVYTYSVVLALANNIKPDMVAGHSLGEISALTVAGVVSFEDGLKLVAKRAEAMQKACEANPSSMAAIIGLEDDLIVKICSEIDDVVIAANFNSPGQVVISGTNNGVDIAIEKLNEAGAKRAIKLAVGGAFHSPLMEPARAELEETLLATKFNDAICPVFQNVDGEASTDGEDIKKKLNVQMVSPVLWTKTVMNMLNAKAELFVESGPGKVLQGLIKKVDRKIECSSL